MIYCCLLNKCTDTTGIKTKLGVQAKLKWYELTSFFCVDWPSNGFILNSFILNSLHHSTYELHKSMHSKGIVTLSFLARWLKAKMPRF